MTRVAAIGEAMIELSLHNDLAQVGVAGDTLNTAIYLKRSAPALDVDYVTCLGQDPLSDRISNFISEQKIGTSEIERIAGKSPGLYAISTTADGERSFTYWRSASAARDVFKTADGYDFSALEQYDLVYLSGISVAILPPAGRSALLQWLRDTSIDLAYDSNYRPVLWEDRKTAQSITDQLWERANICLPSIDDEMALFEEDAQAVTRRFQRYGSKGALKRGPSGPLALGEPVEQTYPAAEQVVDTTAAGDSFNGGYLAALLSGATQTEALMAGHTCAARVVQFRGAIVPEATA